MHGYLIPANAKRGTLIFNIFRPFDLILFSIGVGVSLLALALVPSTSLVAVILAILPAGICGLLILPIPNYHNVLCALDSMYRFYTGQRHYRWKGWCFYEQFKDSEQKSTK